MEKFCDFFTLRPSDLFMYNLDLRSYGQLLSLFLFKFAYLWNMRCKISLKKTHNCKDYYFPRQSLKIFTFRFKLSDSIFFLLGHSPIVKLI